MLNFLGSREWRSCEALIMSEVRLHTGGSHLEKDGSL